MGTTIDDKAVQEFRVRTGSSDEREALFRLHGLGWYYDDDKPGYSEVDARWDHLLEEAVKGALLRLLRTDAPWFRACREAMSKRRPTTAQVSAVLQQEMPQGTPLEAWLAYNTLYYCTSISPRFMRMLRYPTDDTRLYWYRRGGRGYGSSPDDDHLLLLGYQERVIRALKLMWQGVNDG